MKKLNLFLATVALSGVLSGAFMTQAVADDAIVSKIDVTSDFSSVDSQMAASYWPGIEADLKEKLAQTFAGRAGENGVEIDVSIRLLAVNAAASTASYTDLNGIEGVVAIRGPDEDSPTKSFPVGFSVVAPEPTQVVMPGVIVLQPDTEDNYNALINAVVGEIEKQVSDIDM